MCDYITFVPKYTPLPPGLKEPIWNIKDKNLNYIYNLNLQISYNDNLLEYILTNKPKDIYKNPHYIEAIKDLFYMDKIKYMGNHTKVLVAIHNNIYQGHIYIFHYENDDVVYAIGIRGRYDKFINDISLPNISAHLLEGVRKYAVDNKCNRIIITYPRPNMKHILENLNFTKLAPYDLDFLKTPLMPDYIHKYEDKHKDETFCFYMRTVEEKIK
jgi:hypothetical protein